MLDIDDNDIGMTVLGLIAIGCLGAAAFSPITFMQVKEVVLVCVAGITGCMGTKKK